MSTPEASGSVAESSLSFRELMQKAYHGYGECNFLYMDNRRKVKEGIVRAYDLHKAAETLEVMLSEERVSTNPILLASFQTNLEAYKSEMKDILETPTMCFDKWENNLMNFVKYQIEHDVRDITKVPDKYLNGWLQRQRARVSAFLDGNRLNLKGDAVEATKDTARLLEHHLHVKWALFKVKAYDDHLAELHEFKDKYKHVNVRRRQEDFPSLGEWVAKMRREYDLFQRGEKVPNLTDARIANLTSLGFIWRIRAPRPRKGDPNYRLRRKSKDGDDEGSSSSENSSELHDGTNNDLQFI